MEPSDTKSNQTSSAIESEHGITTYGDLQTHPATGIDSVHISVSGKKLRSSSITSSSSSSSSSSPKSPFRDSFQEDESEHYESAPSTSALHELDENAYLVSKQSENDVSGSPISKSEQSNHELPVSTLRQAVTSDIPESNLNNVSATDLPPIQVMERSDESQYRIPSSVFARTKSTAPVEWSIASNESLFSIHTGHMSFNKDAIFWRSGELGMTGEASRSNMLFNFSPNDPPVHEATNSATSSEGIGVAKSSVDTMGEVLRESSEDRSSTTFSIAPSTSRHSTGSGTSVKSFAFPILTGNTENGGSAKMSQSPKLGLELPQLQPQPSQQSPPKPEPEPEPEPEPGPKTPVATSNTAQTKWFSCFSCCSFRS